MIIVVHYFDYDRNWQLARMPEDEGYSLNATTHNESFVWNANAQGSRSGLIRTDQEVKAMYNSQMFALNITANLYYEFSQGPPFLAGTDQAWSYYKLAYQVNDAESCQGNCIYDDYVGEGQDSIEISDVDHGYYERFEMEIVDDNITFTADIVISDHDGGGTIYTTTLKLYVYYPTDYKRIGGGGGRNTGEGTEPESNDFHWQPFGYMELLTEIPWTLFDTNTDGHTSTFPEFTERNVSVIVEEFTTAASIVMWRVDLTCTMTPSAAEVQAGDSENTLTDEISFVYNEPIIMVTVVQP